jgi:arylsulfatase A-like enzyme
MARTTAIGVAWAVFIFLAGFGPALIAPKLHPAASVVLLAGVAIQSARLVRSRADRVDALIRRSLPAVLLVAVLAGLGQVGVQEIRARRAEASLPAAAAGAPNVVLIVLDTVRAASLNLYGYERVTSHHLDEFAGNGVIFEHAFATSSWTLPSHASMFTGRLPHEVSADWLTPLDGTHQTLAETLAGRGYSTVGFVANVLYATEASGLNRGFQRYSDFPRSLTTVIRQSLLVRPLVNRVRDAMGDTDPLVRKTAEDVTTEFSDWLDARQTERPFFAFLNYFDAHQPYRSPPPFNTTGGRTPDLSKRRTWSAQEIQRSRDAYDSAIAYVDEEVSSVIDHLRDLNLLDNTLIVITSDHGEQFGEHGLFDHGNSLYRAVLEVPLVMRLPSRIPAGLRVPAPVSLVDLPATILGLVAPDAAAALPGRSLAQHWTPSLSASVLPAPAISDISKGINLPAWVPVSKGRMRSVVLDGVHYILNGDGSQELYDFVNDPGETNNLIERADMQGKLAAARHALDQAGSQEAQRR